MSMYSDICKRLRRAVKNGQSLHLTSTQAKALLTRSDIYGVLAALEAQELNDLCQQDNLAKATSQPQPSAINSAPTGFGIAPTAMIGPSPGILTAAMAGDVASAASRLASEAVMAISRRKKLKTR